MFKIIAKTLIYFYKFFISPLLPKSCRFLPSCSSYSLEAIKRYGFICGSLLTLKRLLSCHPFSKKDMHDPVPEKLPNNRIFTFFSKLRKNT
jgi:putative membrane protein insertion efficiency factor